jgi:uncharacterized protein (DUF433 family)
MIDRTLLERIESDSRILCGKPVIRGTRISVELILEKLSYGDDFETICREFDIEQNDVKAALWHMHQRMFRKRNHAGTGK